MTNEEYHGDTSRISKSGLDLIDRSPLHYYQKYLAPNRVKQEPTAALLAGSIFHKITLEEETFKKEFMTLPPNAPAYPGANIWGAKNPSADSIKAMEFWKQMEALYPNVTIITQEEHDLGRRMRDAVMAHPAARKIIEMGGRAERTVLFTEETTGAPCKCRPDFETREDIVMDLKSALNASPEKFGKAALEHRYHCQASFYIDGINADAGYEKVRHFVFIACEKEPPFAVGVYFIDQEAMDLGRREYIANCETYMKCLASNHWPGYGDQIQALQIPTWAYRKK